MSARSTPPAVVASVTVGAPPAAALAGWLAGAATGPVFAFGAVLGAVVAVALATTAGLWWVIPAQPLLIVPVAVLAALLGRQPGEKSKQLAIDAVRALEHAFPVAAAAVVCAVIAAFVKHRSGRGRREPAGDSRRRRPAPARAGRTGGGHRG